MQNQTIEESRRSYSSCQVGRRQRPICLTRTINKHKNNSVSRMSILQKLLEDKPHCPLCRCLMDKEGTSFASSNTYFEMQYFCNNPVYTVSGPFVRSNDSE